MASNFKNSLLDIQYNLAQNLIYNEAALPELDNRSRDTAIEIWKNYLVRIISDFEAKNDKEDISCSNFNFKDWFQKGKVEIIRDADNKVSADILESFKVNVLKIGSEIFKFTEILTKLNFSLSKETLLEFVKGFYITPHRTFDYVKTATYLIEKTDLKIKYKFEIACYYCLKEQILKFNKKYREENGVKIIYSDRNLMKVFWTLHLERKCIEVNNKIRKILIYWAIENRNEPSLSYIWENFNGNALKDNIIDIIKYSLTYYCTNITCYLITKVNNENILKALCKEYGHTILSKLLFNSRWSNYYKKAAFYVQTFISEMTFLNAIKTVIVYSLENGYDKEQHRILLGILKTTFGVGINADFVFAKSMETFLLTLLFMEDENIVKKLLNVRKIDELKSLFDGDEIMILVGNVLLAKKQRRLFENLISMVLVGDAIMKFKARFFYANSRTFE